MKDKAADLVVRHNAAQSRFEAAVDGTLSVADYERREGEMIMSEADARAAGAIWPGVVGT